MKASQNRSCLLRGQRKPKYPKTNKMITTAPTSQMTLFMIPFLSLD
jgi:hypothetical protein